MVSVFHKANKNDGQTLYHLLKTANRKISIKGNYTTLLADKGYDSQTCRKICCNYNLDSIIPRRRTKDVDRRRYVIEQTFGILDQFRRIRVRYESLLCHFKSFHFLAMIHIVGNR